jgi:hypothetical protein
MCMTVIPLPLQARDYTANKAEGRALARGDVPFLFRAFEAGQVRPSLC